MTANKEKWHEKLILTNTGTPKPLLANAIAALRESPAWFGILAYDEFALRTTACAALPWDVNVSTWTTTNRAWSPHDDLMVADWLQRQGISVNAAVAAQAVEAVAKDRTFHPVRDYLNGLEHDGELRLDKWLQLYLGVARSRYTEEIGQAMLIAAVARIFEPGCKVDTLPILEGPQGARKSSAVKALFHPWFTDELADLGSKDAAMQTRGVWGLEVSELDALSRAESSRLKAFISRTNDRFRPPYGSRIIESPRSCVFWGTTNSDEYLKDETGGRRFWPIRVGKIDIERLQDNRDQLWAEAVFAHREQRNWWISHSDVQRAAEAEQQDRYQTDSWAAYIRQYVQGKTRVTIEEILGDVFHFEKSRQGQAEYNKVARCLKSQRWQRKQIRVPGTSDRTWFYVPPVVTSGDEEATEAEQSGNVTTMRMVTR
jgi:predicted P-loop ATPase